MTRRSVRDHLVPFLTGGHVDGPALSPVRASAQGMSSIPAGVLSNPGLWLPVWNLQYTAGQPGALVAPVAGQNGIPVGTSIDALNVFFPQTGGPYNVSGVDWSGRTVWVDTVTVNFTNCKFYKPGGLLVMFGRNGGSVPTVTFTNCLGDCTNCVAPGSFEAPFYGGGTISATNSLFKNAKGDFFSSTALVGTWSFTDCAFINGCRDPGAGHYDGIGHLYGGSYALTRCLVYHPAGAPQGAWLNTGGVTGTMFPEPTAANITGTIDQCILEIGGIVPSGYTVPGKAFYNVQYGANATNTTNAMTLTNSLLDRGQSGYVLKAATVPAGTLTHSGNADLYTGASIEAQLP